MKLYTPPINDVITISRAESDSRDLQPLRKPRKPEQTLEFHLRFGAPESRSVLIRVDAPNQRRAEQFAQAWATRCWFKDKRNVQVYQTFLID